MKTAALLTAILCLSLPSPAGGDEPKPATDADAKLKPGEFQWHPERSESGPVLMVVSRDDQVIYVYRNGIEIARSTVSTGKKGHTTPTGVFQILQKHKDHYSSIYKNAPMPYMQRLTWQGIALHAGNLPGYPASHGCIRLPYDFSKNLFGVTAMGATIVVTSEHSPPKSSLKPYDIIKSSGKSLRESGRLKPLDSKYVIGWFPEKQKEGQLSIVISSGSKIAHVLRNGIEIGRCEFGMKADAAEFPAGIFLMLDKESEEDSPVVKGKKRKTWATVALDKKAKAKDPWAIFGKVDFPQEFASVVYDELEPGTLLIFTPEELEIDKRSETGFVVATAETGVKKPEDGSRETKAPKEK